MIDTAKERQAVPPAAIEAALREAGLVPAGARAVFTPLTGGVSSDIWKVETPARTFAVKRALPKLRVAADWRAPVSRNASEAGWMRTVAQVEPGAVPEVIFHDPRSGLFAMTYLPGDHYPLWKAQLRDGHVNLAFAAQVGRTLARIHTATAGSQILAQEFANDGTFHAIRLEPYLEATAARHRDIAALLMTLSRETLACHRALVHGDVSPKNILAGPQGPVFLDAECAWYGDPAFDLAFCLNHLLLKCVWNRAAAPDFLSAFDTLGSAYLAEAGFEDRAGLEARTARLLPALFLARIDGKSPVEYITSESDCALVRGTALALIREEVLRLDPIRNRWACNLGLDQG
ncbi:MAG TPA: aminoglycoside phosphotransferase family protein [Pseudorhodoplanes sp.]|nr:aminoglycoside phosphotransferase family protein [Pseudorhodoplanes sp.]